jgi:hypothetical protein
MAWPRPGPEEGSALESISGAGPLPSGNTANRTRGAPGRRFSYSRPFFNVALAFSPSTIKASANAEILFRSSTAAILSACATSGRR